MLVALCLLLFGAQAAPLTMDGVKSATMHPYTGRSEKGVDTGTMEGKILCGYQGWFATPGDSSERGWFHWSKDGSFHPGDCKIDLWPDVSELSPSELYRTDFTLPNGSPAEVFSSYNRKTVLRHFQWMREYGIDGVFVQRFITQTQNPVSLRFVNTVLDHCREGANVFGRAYAVMYDLSGLGANQIDRVENDWRDLIDRMKITSDPAYLHHKSKPVVAVWGFGFNDGRKYTLKEGLKLVDFLKSDPRYGGCCVMLGVPTYWREMNRDAVSDPDLLSLVQKADIVSPWTVGRYGTPAQAENYASETLAGDIAWCKDRGLELMPVAFPGFSWHNMFPGSPLNQIPRLRGRFLWSQYGADMKAGATMIYQAMFDEMDEGTAVFKCANAPPVGASQFVTYDGLPSDTYLRLVGEGSKSLAKKVWVKGKGEGVKIERP